MERGATIATIIVAAHLLAGAAHGYVHDRSDVVLTATQTAFVWIVATGGPIAAVVLVRREAVRRGGALLASSAIAAAAFGAYYHAVADTTDHVHAVNGPWQEAFVATAALVLATDLAAAFVGLPLYRRADRDEWGP